MPGGTACCCVRGKPLGDGLRPRTRISRQSRWLDNCFWVRSSAQLLEEEAWEGTCITWWCWKSLHHACHAGWHGGWASCVCQTVRAMLSRRLAQKLWHASRFWGLDFWAVVPQSRIWCLCGDSCLAVCFHSTKTPVSSVVSFTRVLTPVSSSSRSSHSRDSTSWSCHPTDQYQDRSQLCSRCGPSCPYHLCSASFRRRSGLFEAGEQKRVVSFSPRARDASDLGRAFLVLWSLCAPQDVLFLLWDQGFPISTYSASPCSSEWLLPVTSSGVTAPAQFQISACNPKFVK